MKAKILLLAACVGGFWIMPAHAVQPDTKVYSRSGNTRSPINILVSSNSAVTPSSSTCFGAGADSQEMNFRAMVVQNPNAYDIFTGTWVFFLPAQATGFVPKSSGTWTTTNSATTYFLVPPNNVSGLITGYISKYGACGGTQ